MLKTACLLKPLATLNTMDAYLQATDVINWQHPTILKQAKVLAAEHKTPVNIAKACFEWVRDQIHHSVDYQLNPVTCRASDAIATHPIVLGP